jgi:CheY-like chemotaxis protein
MPTHISALILEDRSADAELMLHALRQSGFDPEWRRVETEAAYLAQLHAGLDVVLADYSLPQFDALRALQLLQERELDIPFIIVSGTLID